MWRLFLSNNLFVEKKKRNIEIRSEFSKLSWFVGQLHSLPLQLQHKIPHYFFKKIPFINPSHHLCSTMKTPHSYLILNCIIIEITFKCNFTLLCSLLISMPLLTNFNQGSCFLLFWFSIIFSTRLCMHISLGS